MKLVALSDTHGWHHRLSIPECDVLIHAGDAELRNWNDVIDFFHWLGKHTARTTLFVPGNHDFFVERNPDLATALAAEQGVTLLLDLPYYLEGLTFYGSPWTPKFYNWAFMRERGKEMSHKWSRIGEIEPDILITHGPPYGHGDLAPGNRHVGCIELLDALTGLVNPPKYHIFGHLHEGERISYSDAIPGTTFLNVSICRDKMGYHHPKSRHLYLREPTEFTLSGTNQY